MMLRQSRNPARRIAGTLRPAPLRRHVDFSSPILLPATSIRGYSNLLSDLPTAIPKKHLISSPRILPIPSARSYANGRPHPPGGTHRIDLGGGEQKSALEQYGVDLTARAKAGKLDPVIGRDAEIHRTIQVLSRRTKNNPVLIGSAGTGKVCKNQFSFLL